MGALSGFFSTNMHFVFFVYGLAFFVMGLVVALEPRRGSQLRLADGLVYLAAFGILTGLAAWVDMFAAVPGLTPSPSTMPLHEIQPINCFECHADPTIPVAGERAGIATLMSFGKLLLMVTATLSLCQFGVKILLDEAKTSRLRFLPLALLTLWLLSMIPARLASSYGAEQWLINGNVLARYFLLVPSSLIVAVGLIRQRTLLHDLALPAIARSGAWAAAFFVLLALAGGLIVPPAPYPPANFLNYSSFFAATGVPIQVVRALIALGIAYFVVRMLRVFTVTNERRLEAAIGQRLAAQQDALEAQQHAREVIEESNRELEGRVIQRTRELQDRNRELGTLNSIANTISHSLNLGEMLHATLAETLALARAGAGAIYLRTGAEDDLRLEIKLGRGEWQNELAEVVPVGVGPIGEAASEARIVYQGGSHAQSGHPTSEAGSSVVCVPLTSKGVVLGVLALLANEEHGLPQDEKRLLEAVGGQIGVAIENATLFDQVQNLAVVEERERLAREMHDGLAQIIGYLHLRIRLAEEMLARDDVESVRSELRQSAGVAQDAYAEVREAILGLRTTVGQEKDFLGTLREFLHKFQQQSQIPTELEIGEDASFTIGPAGEVQLIRIIQEALTNVRKHAKATRATVRFDTAEDWAIVTIADNGRGFEWRQGRQDEGHYGLQTMRERAESVAGSLQVHSAPGQGTEIIVRLPLALEGGREHGADTDSVGGRSRALQEGTGQPSR